MSEFLIENATVYDGTGKPPFTGSIWVQDDLIKEVITGSAKAISVQNRMDAQGAAVTPGFIDIHRHADYALFGKEFGLLELSQGLTTMVNGNCGMSGAPIDGKNAIPLKSYQAPVMGYVPEGADIVSAADYFKAVRIHRPAVNAGLLIGIGTLAASANGLRAPFSKETLPIIHRNIEQALTDGAVGVSLGLGYMPAFSYSEKDLLEILAPVAHSGYPVAVHMRQEGDGMPEALEETVRLAKALDTPFEISHIKAIGKKNRRKILPAALKKLREARAEGISVYQDVYPYIAGSTQLEHILPPEACGREAEILKDRQLFSAYLDRIENGTDYENVLRLCGPENVYPGSMHSDFLRPFNGMNLKDGAAAAGVTPPEFLLMILSLERPSMIDYYAAKEDVEEALADPETAVISDSIYPADGNLHPRVAGAYTRIIEKYVLQEKLLSLEEAVRKMTALPAARMRLKDRGILKKGMKADICLFRPEELHEQSMFGKPVIPSRGMRAVFVNGQPALWNGAIKLLHTGECIVGA